jgi:hypothetical protein
VAQDPEQLFSASLAKALADAAKTRKVFDSAAEKLVADAQTWGKQVAAITNSVATAAIAQANVAQQLNQMLRPIQEALNQAYANLDLSWVPEALKAGMPPNWQDFDSGEVDRILTVMDETGWCLVWSPRADVIRGLIEATDMDAQSWSWSWSGRLRSRHTGRWPVRDVRMWLIHAQSSGFDLR